MKWSRAVSAAGTVANRLEVGMRVKSTPRTCAQCGTVYVVRYDHAAVQRFCSRKCSALDRRGTLIEKLLSKFVVNPVTGCWEWTGRRSPQGYGQFQSGGRKHMAPRASYEWFVGPFSKRLVMRHVVCDNPPCINPDHLAPGTRKDNANDMLVKGRSRKGERHPHHKLTESDVLEIRQCVAKGETKTLMKSRYDVSWATICDAIARRTWRHI